MLAEFVLTPSMMSISPFTGHGSRPRAQKAGQVPQMPPGMCLMSRTKRPWL